MNSEDVKDRWSMKDVLTLCGISQPNRAGFICCPFHKGDRDPSMKIYEKDYHCFACGANGDIFSFVQRFYDISFKEAFLMLGGTYDRETFDDRLIRYRNEKARNMRRKKEAEMKRQIRDNNEMIDVYRSWIDRLQPLSSNCTKAFLRSEIGRYGNPT